MHRIRVLEWLGQARIAARSVIRQKHRTRIAIASIAAGVISLVLAGGFIDWIYWSMREHTIGSRLGHVQVARAGYFTEGTADPQAYLLPATSSDLATIASQPEVVTVAPRLALSGLLSHGETTVSFVGEGIDAALEQPLNRFVTMTSGEPLSESDPEGVIVGSGLAANAGVKVGDTIVLLVNRASGGISAVEARVRGTFATATKAYDDAALRMPIAMARQLLQTTGSHVWVVLLSATDQTEPVVERLRSRIDPRYEIVPWQQQADFYNKTVALFSKQVGVLYVIIAAIIVLSISNTLTMSVLERTSEIGTMMALGASRASIRWGFLTEGTLLGIVGAAAGLLLSIPLALGISAIGIPMPPPPGLSHGFVGEIRLGGALAAKAFLLAALTTMAASIYPAWKASRMVIVDALRTNR